MKIYFKRLIVCAWAIFSLVACGSSENNSDEPGVISQSEVSYIASTAKFPNPERGFYKYTQSELGSNPTMLGELTLKSYRTQNISLIYRIYYLRSFRDKALSPEALNQIDTDMATLRKSGLKCVLRFAYSGQETEPDAPLDIILKHLDQLKPVFEKNADVIAVLQAGFIGAWGEWYYSSNNLKTSGIRATILNKMLEVLPARRMIQLRTPAYKTEYLQRTTALAKSEAFTETKVARIGHHNDCFLASKTDYGTYVNIDAEKNYINSEGVYLPVGGETCPPDGVDPADCAKAESEMRRLRWSFLNQDYYEGVIKNWITQGCMDNIIRELGYRFVLHSGSFTDKIAPEGTLTIQLKVNNVGYACPYNPRKVEFILKNTQTAQLYVAAVEEDPRFWRPLTETVISKNIGIPKDMPSGTYDLLLNLPDPEPQLYGNPDYSIQLANENVWNKETGYNNLFQQITIGNFPSEVYKGDVYFNKK
ncbi:MAG: DUF4832 domain-containing protein [Candidatus Symbiothrix sp.]|jgi:hypothetical protein|nr:DUF4832 domain-containing protein [Candidatus Symbiothrix sp.]